MTIELSQLPPQFLTGRLPKDEVYCAALPQLSEFTLPTPEKKWSNVEIVGQTLQASVGELYPIDGNDREGNCTCAGAIHAGTLLAGLTGKKIIPTAQNALDLYHSLGGRGMSGLQLTTVLKRWHQGFFGLEPILADVNIDPGNQTNVRQAINFLGGVYIGFATTSTTVSDFQNGIPWDGSGRPGGGHCVWVDSYDDYTKTFKLLTWGGWQTATQAWWDRFVDEVHCVVTRSSALFTQDEVADLTARMKSLAV